MLRITPHDSSNPRNNPIMNTTPQCPRPNPTRIRTVTLPRRPELPTSSPTPSFANRHRLSAFCTLHSAFCIHHSAFPAPDQECQQGGVQIVALLASLAPFGRHDQTSSIHRQSLTRARPDMRKKSLDSRPPRYLTFSEMRSADEHGMLSAVIHATAV